MLDTLTADVAAPGDSSAAVDSDGVDESVRALLLGAPAERKACPGCGAVNAVRDWTVEVTLESNLVGYAGRCPACDRRDAHRIVDWLPHR